jgi:hypothetical protein
MSAKSKMSPVNFQNKVFDIQHEPRPRGAWWWWFWLFFFNNPQNPKKPRQLMILWSSKNVKKISCNDLQIVLKLTDDRRNLDGAVAAWYYDGKKTRHNFVLEQCNLKISKTSLISESKTPTSFTTNGTQNIVKIGDDIEFVTDQLYDHEFAKPSFHGKNFVGKKGYSILKINHQVLSGKVDGKKINGTAYFQRVFVNAPAVPWYWGIFHFDSGAILTYTNQFFLGKSIKEDISFFDGKRIHSFDQIKVVRKGGEVPDFYVTGQNEIEAIKFSVSSYAHSWWTFKKRSLGFIPNKLTYNEYPATITDFVYKNTKTGTKISKKELGKSIGNAEHTVGYLF